MKVLLKIHNLSISYESVKILDGVSFDINAGDFVAVMGPNGTGKTTLLKVVSKILKPKLGTVLIDDEDIQHLTNGELAKKVGVVAQDPPPAFGFTCLDIVLMGRSPYLSRLGFEKSLDYEIARSAMQMTDTWEIAEKAVDQISGGERQRVLIARALAQRPLLLLLDEPTLHLDISNQLNVMQLLKHLARNNRMAVVCVIHDFNLASRFCEKIIMLSSGKIASVGKPEDVFTYDTILKVYGVRTEIGKDQMTGSVTVTPLGLQRDLFQYPPNTHQ